MGKLHVFGLICLTLARHFWGHCATAAHCPAAARLDSVAPRHRFSQLFLDSYPKIAWAGFGFVFLLFLFGQKQQGIFPPLKEQQCLVWERMRSRKGRKRLSHCVFSYLTAFLHLHQTSTGENWGFAGLPERCCRRGNIFHSPVASCVFLLTLSSLYRVESRAHINPSKVSGLYKRA